MFLELIPIVFNIAISDFFSETTINKEDIILNVATSTIKSINSNNIVFSNNTTLAGHVIVGDHVTLGGFTGIHQFCHLGEGCFSAISSIITKDIPPFITVKGNPATPRCINKIGLQRRGYSQDEMNSLRKCFRILYLQSNSLERAIQKIDSEIDKHKVVQKFRDFVTESDRGIAR